MAETYDVTTGVNLPPVGDPLPRYEAREKVIGATPYAADEPLAGALHAVLVTTPVARGRVRGVDAAAAMAVPGVRLVLTHENAARTRPVEPLTVGGQMQSSYHPLSSPEVRYAGQAVALVAAETVEAAREAARLLVVDVEAEPDVVASMHHEGAPAPETLPREVYEPAVVGDLEAVLAQADAVVEAEYRTPIQHHNPIELWSTSAQWGASGLTAHVPSQWLTGTRAALATAFDLPVERVRVVSKFVGGGFGSKAQTLWHTVIAADAARQAGRPVKLHVGRDQMFTLGQYRPSSTNRVRIGARDGRLTGFEHAHIGQTSRFDTYADAGTEITARMYAYDAVRTSEEVVRVDTNTPGFMRAPVEVASVFALECAIDELCVATGTDPVAMRIASDSDRDPVEGFPWTSRSLVECLERGAEAFGWAERPREPRAQARGDWLFGQGMATAIYPTYVAGGTAELRVGSDLSAKVSAAAHDLGTGAYTVVRQIVSRELGLPPERIRVEMGDSDLPSNSMAGGSSHTASYGSAVLDACRRVRARLTEIAVAEGGPLAGADPAAIAFEDGRMIAGDRSADMEAVFEGVMFGVIEERGSWRPAVVPVDSTRILYRRGLSGYTGFVMEEVVQAAFGAQFVEVAVHRLTGEVRVPRMAGAFAAGRILNERLARSQLMGGMIWGVGSALHEATEVDPRFARFVNADLGEYAVVVNADVPEVRVEIVEEVDERVNPLGIKGIGELGIVGVNAAIANAIHHATGRRLRETPIRMEQLIG